MPVLKVFRDLFPCITSCVRTFPETGSGEAPHVGPGPVRQTSAVVARKIADNRA